MLTIMVIDFMAGETFHFRPDGTEVPKTPEMVTPDKTPSERANLETPLERIKRLSAENSRIANETSLTRRFGSDFDKKAQKDTLARVHGDNAIKGLADAFRGQALLEAAEAIAKEGATSETFARFARKDMMDIEDSSMELMRTAQRIIDLEEAEGVKVGVLGPDSDEMGIRDELRKAHKEHEETQKNADALLERLKNDYPDVQKALSRPEESVS